MSVSVSSEDIYRVTCPRTLDLDEFDQDEVTLRVIMGPQDKSFTTAGRKTFLESEYTVTSEFDRMGCRLEGPFIAYKTTSDIISDGIAFGSVQVPSHGKPIILLSDRQTTGGYAKLPLSFPWIFQNWFSGKQTTKYGFRQLLWKKPSN